MRGCSRFPKPSASPGFSRNVDSKSKPFRQNAETTGTGPKQGFASPHQSARGGANTFVHPDYKSQPPFGFPLFGTTGWHLLLPPWFRYISELTPHLPSRLDSPIHRAFWHMEVFPALTEELMTLKALSMAVTKLVPPLSHTSRDSRPVQRDTKKKTC